jgi:hypothetical protein
LQSEVRPQRQWWYKSKRLNPLMETPMERTPQRDRLTQLGLFWERAAVPRWSELSEPTRVEVVRLLAQLLREAQAPALRSEGADDE